MLKNKERKILKGILNNAKTPLNTLSKKLGISRELIDYHIKKLEQKGYILGYQARINLGYFTPLHYNLLVKFKKRDSDKEEHFFTFLKSLPYTFFISRVAGEYDVIIGFGIQKIAQLGSYINAIYEHYDELVDQHELFTELEELKDDFTTLIDPQQISAETSKQIVERKEQLDEVEKQIVNLLTKNGRESSVQIGTVLNLTSAAVSYRIKKLERENIILGYRTLVDLMKFEKEFYYVFFNVSSPTKENERKAIEVLKTQPYIIWATKVAGNDSYLCLVYADNNAQFSAHLKVLQEKISNMTKMSVYLMLEFMYHNYLPPGLVELGKKKEKARGQKWTLKR